MNTEEFAARRRVEFVKVDEELYPLVEKALTMYASGRSSWARELIDEASRIWLDHFKAEAPNADPTRFIARFRDSLEESLSKTERPEGMITEGQVNRVGKWIGTYTLNDATYSGTGARGGRFKRWVTMHDNAVRGTHRPLDGQIVPVGATFNVGAHDLRFPGDPVGPPELWINCRCVVQPAGRVGEANMSPTTFAIVEEDVVDDEEIPFDEPEDDEELITEIPVHGVLAPEGIPTGDGRQFGIDSLTHRDLPLPIAYQLQSGEGHAGSVTVGRIDEVFREGNEMRFRGALTLNRDATNEVIDGIIDGTVRGVSVDVDDVEVDMSEYDMEEENPGRVQVTVFSSARIAGVTIVPIPAFQEAFIALGHEWPDESEDDMTPEEALAACGCRGPEDEDENPDIVVGNNEFRQYDAEARKRMAGNGQALPDGSFPIADEEDLRNAIQAIGRASDPDEARAHIKKRARALGKESLIPDEWALVAAAFAPGTKDGPGWITHPIPTARIRRYWVHGKGAAKIRWGVGAPGGDFNRCRRQLAKYVQNPKWLAGLCANMHKEATGVWPGSRINRGRRGSLAASGEPAPIFNLVAAASYVFDSSFFAKPQMKTPRVGVVVEDDHVYGYIAQWGVCHVGISGVCTEAPPSKTDYWYYATGVVDTDQGEVRVGQITMDTGHANMRANAKVAAAHYDNTGAAVADVTVGEDEFGIWFSGALRPNITDAQRHALRASGRVSGDWRTIGRDLELVAALAVNVPGFPIPHARAGVYDGKQVSLVAAGLHEEEAPVESQTFSLGPNEVVGLIKSTVAEMRHQEKVRAEAEPLRQTLRQRELANLRAKIKE